MNDLPLRYRNIEAIKVRKPELSALDGRVINFADVQTSLPENSSGTRRELEGKTQACDGSTLLGIDNLKQTLGTE